MVLTLLITRKGFEILHLHTVGNERTEVGTAGRPIPPVSAPYRQTGYGLTHTDYVNYKARHFQEITRDY